MWTEQLVCQAFSTLFPFSHAPLGCLRQKQLGLIEALFCEPHCRRSRCCGFERDKTFPCSCSLLFPASSYLSTLGIF